MKTIMIGPALQYSFSRVLFCFLVSSFENLEGVGALSLRAFLLGKVAAGQSEDFRGQGFRKPCASVNYEARRKVNTIKQFNFNFQFYFVCAKSTDGRGFAKSQ